MTTEQRTGFRLPWSSDRSPEPAASNDGNDGAGMAEGAVRGEERAGPGRTEAGGPAEGGSWVMAGSGWAAEPAEGFDEAIDPDPAFAAAGMEAAEATSAAWPAADMARVGGTARGADESGRSDAEPAAQPEPVAQLEPVAVPERAAPERAAPERAAPERAASARPVGSSASNGSASGPTRFLAEMSRAMQAAAQAARDDSLARLAAEAKQKVDQIQEQGTTGTANLRRRADDDVAATREWSKAEIARIREETDQRIAERKAQLEVDVDRHVASIKRRTELVRDAVARHEAELAAFIDRLMAEHDPARIATLAQELPEPPVLDEVEADDAADPAEMAAGVDGAREHSVASRPTTQHEDRGPEAAASIERLAADEDAEVEATATAEVDAMEVSADVEGVEVPADVEAEGTAEVPADVPAEVPAPKPVRGGPKLSAAGAAAAEAEALAGLEDSDEPVSVPVDRRAVPAGGVARTELIVTGLASVPSIAGFKRELSRLAGVRSVGVSAGEAGQFIFAVGHDSGVDLADGIPTIAAFAAQLTGRRTGSLLVSASEPATGE